MLFVLKDVFIVTTSNTKVPNKDKAQLTRIQFHKDTVAIVSFAHTLLINRSRPHRDDDVIFNTIVFAVSFPVNHCPFASHIYVLNSYRKSSKCYNGDLFLSYRSRLSLTILSEPLFMSIRCLRRNVSLLTLGGFLVRQDNLPKEFPIDKVVH